MLVYQRVTYISVGLLPPSVARVWLNPVSRTRHSTNDAFWIGSHGSGNSPFSENQCLVQAHQALPGLNIFDSGPEAALLTASSVHVTFVQLDFICQIGLSREDVDILDMQQDRDRQVSDGFGHCKYSTLKED